MKSFTAIGFILLCSLVSTLAVSEVETSLQKAISNPSIEDLRAAWSSVNSIPVDRNLKNWNTQKVYILEGYLNVMRVTLKHFDPTIINSPAPRTRIVVPGDTYIRDSQINPSEVKDPKIRDEYIKTIADSEKQFKLYNYQQDIKHMLDDGKNDIVHYLNRVLTPGERFTVIESIKGENATLLQTITAENKN
ncbi:MAG: hypothetical protein ABI615_10615 [Chthoniobacterales bacterium]